MNLTENEKHLFKLLLEYAKDLMGNRICNDLTREMEDCLTQEEWDNLNLEMHLRNGDPEEYQPGKKMPDWLALWILSKKAGF